jgi:hypothetical protein
VRLQGFAPSCRFHPPAPFRPVKAGDAHGVLPFEASPSDGAVASLDARCLPAVSPSSPLPRPRRTTGGRVDGRGFKALLPVEVRHTGRGLAAPVLDAPLGFTALGRFRLAWPPASRALPSQASPTAPKSDRRPLRVSIREPVGFVPRPNPKIDSLCETTALLRFSHLVSASACFELASVPGFRRRGRATSLPLDGPSKERPPSSPGGLAEGVSVSGTGSSSDPRRQYIRPRTGMSND